jgi:RNA polymerase sigma-70 factor, ECF subfamily
MSNSLSSGQDEPSRSESETLSAALADVRVHGVSALGPVFGLATPPLEHAVTAWLARANLHRRVNAEDIIQETFVRASAPIAAGLAAKDGSQSRAVLAYLTTVARNLVITEAKRLLRTQRLDTDLAENLPAASTGPASRIANDETVRRSVERFAGAMARLSREDAEIVRLRGIEGEPAAAIARLFGLSDDAVHARYSRARRQLAAWLGGDAVVLLAAES